VFEEAVRIRNADPANLDTLATNSVVRMENPVVKSRDEKLNVTVCTGRFVLELPPGAERGFGGQRRLVADVEYAAQGAVDGSGLVYQLNGAEPIVYRLAAFDLQRQQQTPGAQPQPQLADATPARAPDRDEEAARPEPTAQPAPKPEPAPKPAPTPRAASEPRAVGVVTMTAQPSFNCGAARTRSERMVCGSPRLAASDRAMSSLYFSSLANADSSQKAALRRTRNRFLAYRERCGSEACIAEAYQGRMMEIRDIMAGRF